MIWRFFAALIFTPVLSYGFNIADLCVQNPNMQKLDDILQTMGPLAGTERKQCGLPGELARICTSCEEKITDEQMKAIRPMLSDRGHREWHALWHETRMEMAAAAKDKDKPENRLRFRKGCPYPDEAKKMNEDLAENMAKQKLPSETFATPEMKAMWEKRGYLPKSPSERETFMAEHNPHNGTKAGEDFLFMHREMIKMVQIKLVSENKGCIRPWDSVPTYDDPQYSQPKERTVRHNSSTHRKVSSQEMDTYHRTSRRYHNEMQETEKRLRDPSFLKSVDLNTFGLCVEDMLHLELHGAYENVNLRCQNRDMRISQEMLSPEKDAALEVAPSCDDLGSMWSSHVNPRFWKLHGMLDSMIGDWLKANGYNEISENCQGRPKCYQWKGTWVGERPKQ